MKLEEMKITKQDGTPDGRLLFFWCPGCHERHYFDVDRTERPNWTFNGDFERPTFTPSLLYPSKHPRCHLFLTDGVLIYLDDCGHDLAGKRVPLPDLPEDQLIGYP
jgi:hypothetical protein